MAINKKLIHFKSRDNFDREVANENILDTSICFIQDSKEISTHGTIYKSVNWSVLDPFNGHEYVDLGLPSGTLWASYNVGATSPEDYGDYFAWGETTTKSSYSSDNSVICNLSISELKSRGIINTDDHLTAAYDAATANWGDNWRMPTRDEIEELIDNCTWEWTTQNEVNGYLVTGSNGNSIFLPATGYHSDMSLEDTGYLGCYWSATSENDGYSFSACYLEFSPDDIACWPVSPDYGHAVRPVLSKNN